MVSLASRARLLGSAALGLGLTMVATSPAQAACNVSGTSVLCVSNTTTTDTSYPVNVPSDRNYDFNVTPVDLDVDAGVLVDGYGLSFTDNTAGAATGLVTFVNDGTVQVNAGNTATAGGLDGALGFTGINSSLSYSGAGDIFNLGIGDGFEALITGTGSLSATIGGSVRADAGDAISVTSTAANGGAISITTVAGETLRASGGEGISVTTAGSGNVAVTNAAAISSGGAGVGTLEDGIEILSTGTGNISVANTGAIGTALDVVANDGIQAEIFNAASAGTISVTGTGALWVADNGIQVETTGTGAVTVNYTGAINSSGGNGINAISTTGALSVTGGSITATLGNGIVATTTTGALSVTSGTINAPAGTGVLATSTTGNQAITVNGNISSNLEGVNATSTSGNIALTTTGGADITSATADAIELVSAGTKTITIGAGSVLLGADRGIRTGGVGTTTLTNAGTISGTSGIALWANGLGDGAWTVTNSTGGIINGRVDLTNNNDTITNSGTWNASGANNFYAGTDVISNLAGGIINIATGTTFNGLETYTQAAGSTTNVAGTAVFSATTLTSAGTINLAAGSALSGLGVVTNTGAINAGAGSSISNTGNFTNAAAGTITTSGAFTLTTTGIFANAGTVVLAPSTFTLLGATGFNNTGTIRAEGGATTITSALALNNTGILDLQDGATNDVLTITGNYNAGTNARLALDIGNTTADRLVVGGNVTGGSTNVLLTPLAGTAGIDTSGILIVDIGGTSGANAFTTTSVMNTVINYSIEKRGNDFFVVAVPNAAAFSPVLVGNLVLDTWYQGAEAFNAMAAARGGESDGGIGLWLQPYYGRDRYGSSTRTFTTTGGTFTIPTRMRTKRHGIQGGVDFNAGMAAVGLTGGYQHAEINNGSPSTEGWNIGAYAMAGGTAGMYGNVLVKYDNDKQDLDFGAFSQSGTRTESTSLGADGEIGFRFPGSGSVGFDASAGLAYVTSKIDTFSFGGIDYDYDTVNSLRGRIGGRAVFYNLAKMFVGGKLMHEFNGDTDLLLDSTTDASVSNRGRGTWGRLEGGFGGGLDTPFMLMGWGDFGDVKGWGVRGGVRLSFGGARVAEMAPPPPPPPPPPAYEPAPVVEEPAPPPPPPPPPPAAGERG